MGPRYCPSVEDKVNRFADKTSHQIFLEPEGLDTHEIYPNGISTSMPFDIQYDMIRSIVGLENAHILRPGYAIEYDYFDPRALRSNFETRAIGGLFFAGQINGTTGYEEAAAQGQFAGINAALQCRSMGTTRGAAGASGGVGGLGGLGSAGNAALSAAGCASYQGDSWLPGRDLAYLGVLVDDLITQGVTEPYRMFTSRAEFRLQLREDNADARLTDVGRALGLVDNARWETFNRKRDAVSRETERLKSTWVNPQSLAAAEAERVLGKAIEREYNLADLLRRPDVTHAKLMDMQIVGKDGVAKALAVSLPEGTVSRETLPELYDTVIEQVEISLKYAGYIDTQREEVRRSAFYEKIGRASCRERV